MRKLIVAAMVSLDGVMQARGGPDEDTSGGFAHGGWIWPYGDPSDTVMDGLFDHPFELVLGRRTYDIFAGYWPQAPGDGPFGHIANAFNGTTKHVATHDAGALDWRHSRALGEDVVAALRELKQQEGPDLVTQGSTELLHQLLASDVVDELCLLVFPVLLGTGKRLFDHGAQAASFRLHHGRTTPTGVLVNRYVREGEVKTGSHDP